MLIEEEESLTDSSVKITHVAIQYDGKTYSLPAPNRHHNVIRKIAEESGVGVGGVVIHWPKL